MFQHILVPLDGSTAGFDALDQALQLANGERTTITALCTIDIRVSNDAGVYLPMGDNIGIYEELISPKKKALIYQTWAEQVLIRAKVRAEEAGIRIRPEIAVGIPYQEIISRSVQYDLLVLGSWETSSTYPGPFLAGKTLWQIVARTRLPAFCAFGLPQKIRTILVAYDDTSEARDALQLAAAWSRDWGLKLIVLTVQQKGQRAQQLLRQARVYAHPVVPRLIARDGDPVEALLAIAGQYQCDLIALGVHSHYFLLKTSLGKVTDALLHRGKLPLLLAH